MSKNTDINNEYNSKKEDDAMNAGGTLKVNNDLFNKFLKMNIKKIDSVVPKNPSISIDDEWRKEDFWDEDTEENNN